MEFWSDVKQPPSNSFSLRPLRSPLKIRAGRASVTLAEPSIASFQLEYCESMLTWMSPEASLRIWMPAIHAGMTNRQIFILPGRA